MKQLLILLALIVGMTSCGGDVQNKVDTPKDGVEVLYFHGKQRCATCQAIEKETQELLYSQFAVELKDGSLRFRIVDITKPENLVLSDKYEISWSSLVIAKYDNGEETSENLTKFAFANARNNPDEFKKVLAAKINQMLK